MKPTRRQFFFICTFVGMIFAILAAPRPAQASYTYNYGCDGPYTSGAYYTAHCYAETINNNGGGNIDDTSSMTVPIPGDVAPGTIRVTSVSARDTGYYYGPGFSIFVGWCGSGNTCTDSQGWPVAATSSFGIAIRRIGPNGYARADINFVMNRTVGTVSAGCSASPNPITLQNGSATTSLSGYGSDPWGGLITQFAWNFGDGTTGETPTQMKLASDRQSVPTLASGLSADRLFGIEPVQAGGGGGGIAPPSLNFSATPNPVYAGQPTTLSWSATPVSGGWITMTSNFYPGEMPASGSYPVTPAAGTTFTITATETVTSLGSGSTTQSLMPTVYPAPTSHPYTAPGTYTVQVTAYSSSGNYGFGSCTVTVLPPPTPTVDLKVNGSNGPLTLPYGSQPTLTWTATNSTSCVASGAWSGSKPLTGTEQTPPLTAGVLAFTLTCANSASQGVDTVTVTVEPPPVPIVDLKASRAGGTPSDGPITVDFNYPVFLTWSTQSATSCAGSGGNTSWFGPKPLQQTQGVSTGNLTISATFVLTCTGLGGARSDSVTVEVLQAPVDFPRALFDGSFAAPRIELNRAGELTIRFDPRVVELPPPGFTIILAPENKEGT